MMLKCTLL